MRKGEIPELPESVKENAVLDMAFSTTLMVDVWLVLAVGVKKLSEFEICCRHDGQYYSTLYRYHIIVHNFLITSQIFVIKNVLQGARYNVIHIRYCTVRMWWHNTTSTKLFDVLCL